MSGDIFDGLTKLANLFVEKVRANVSAMNVPHEISDVIYIDPPKMNQGGSYSIEVKIPMRDGAEAAAAFEFGSGKWEKGGAGGYYIFPRYENALRIDWADWPGFELPVIPGPRMIGAVGADGLLLRHVLHPGVRARPYIAPALDDVMEEVKNILSRSIRAELSILDGKGVEVIIV